MGVNTVKMKWGRDDKKSRRLKWKMQEGECADCKSDKNMRELFT
jgi:hypothetical protein